jgi:hypothetical protein
MLETPEPSGTLVDSAGNPSAKITVRAYLGSITDYEANRVYLAIGTSNAYAILNTDANNIITLLTAAGFTWNTFGEVQYAGQIGVVGGGIVGSSDPSTMNVQVKHLVVEYYVRVANLGRSVMRPNQAGTAVGRGSSGYGRRR